MDGPFGKIQEKVCLYFTETKTYQNALTIAHFLNTWKRILKTKLTADMVSHIYEEIS